MAHPRSEHSHARPRPRTNWFIWGLVAVLLLAVLVGTIWVPIYNRTTPALGSWPFFYWYQLLWVPVVALVSFIAYLLSRSADRGVPRAAAPAPPPPGSPSGGAGPAAAPPDPAPPPLPKRRPTDPGAPI